LFNRSSVRGKSILTPAGSTLDHRVPHHKTFAVPLARGRRLLSTLDHAETRRSLLSASSIPPIRSPGRSSPLQSQRPLRVPYSDPQVKDGYRFFLSRLNVSSFALVLTIFAVGKASCQRYVMGSLIISRHPL